MRYMVNHPRVLCVVCFLGLWLVARLGSWFRLRSKMLAEPGEADDTGNLGLVIPATLTLLGLIIGFTFSMATTRYDQRKLFEEGEANAIGTEWARAELLPAAQVPAIHALLLQYLDHRVTFYRIDYGTRLAKVDGETVRLQGLLWQAVLPVAAAAPTPVTALVVSGMNDVLNSQGYTQFSWWNRIPPTAWGLMIIIAVFANGLVGYGTRRTTRGAVLLFVLPLIVSISLFLIADLDSPRGGVILVKPMDLVALQQQLHAAQQ